MLDALLQFINMHGYGWYIWSAYVSVVLALGIQWYLPWRRYQQYRKQIIADKN